MRIAIIGAGHNGLVCAAYIARNGHDVVVYERNERVGGLCVTEELFPGFKVSTLATHFGMLRKEIMDDLTLQAFGLKAYVNDPAMVMLFSGSDGCHMVRSRSGLATFQFDVSAKDKNSWSKFWAEIAQAGSILSPFLLRTGVTQYELGEEMRSAGLKEFADKLFDGCLTDYVEERFESPYLKAAICSSVFEVPTKKGTLFDCVYYSTSQACGINGATGLVRGGMGTVTHSLRLVCQSHGVEIRTGSAVKKVLIEGTRAYGVELGDGTEERFDAVIANADPRTTFTRLVDEKYLPEPLKKSLKAPFSPVSSGKVHFALSSLPQFAILDGIQNSYSSDIAINPDLERMIKSADQLSRGEMPDDLVLSVNFPSVTDETIAPRGKHLMSVDVHHVPTSCGNEPWNDSNSQVLLSKVMSTLEGFAPNLARHIEGTVVLTPGHIQDRFGVATAHCDHLPMTSDYLVEKRRLPFCGQHTTPIEKLYLCGAGTFPGGGVSGAPGYNCARLFGSIGKPSK